MGPKKKRLWAPAIKIVNALKAVQSYLPASTEKNSPMFFALFQSSFLNICRKQGRINKM